MKSTHAKPSVKQHLATGRMLFDWLVTGHVVDVNPAHSVRGPKHVVTKGLTPVLDVEETKRLRDSIPVTRGGSKGAPGEEAGTPNLIGLRYRTLIAAMFLTFARVGAVVAMTAEDYYPQGKRWWLRLWEKGGKQHDMPAPSHPRGLPRRVRHGRRHRRRPQGPPLPLGPGDRVRSDPQFAPHRRRLADDPPPGEIRGD